MTNATVVQAVIAIAILCVLIAAAYYVVASFRDYGDDDRQTPAQSLANLQEMHLRGDISDEEFRTIKARTRLASDAVDPSHDDSSILARATEHDDRETDHRGKDDSNRTPDANV